MSLRDLGDATFSNELPLVTVVTPCFNGARYIEETILSVIANSAFTSGRMRLEYFVCDGGSTDETCYIVERLIEGNRNANVQINFVSESDTGMYDALAKGLRNGRGDIFGYINAGDLLSPKAFEIVGEVLASPGVQWVTGLQVYYNERSHLLTANVPFTYRRDLIRCGAYGRWLPFIQQESTFWSKSLTGLLDLETLRSFRLAGDFYLWKTFAEHTQLYVVEAWLGGFKIHRDQLSEDLTGYRSEMATIARRARVRDALQVAADLILWNMPNKFKRVFGAATRFVFSFRAQSYELQLPRRQAKNHSVSRVRTGE